MRKKLTDYYFAKRKDANEHYVVLSKAQSVKKGVKSLPCDDGLKPPNIEQNRCNEEVGPEKNVHFSTARSKLQLLITVLKNTSPLFSQQESSSIYILTPNTITFWLARLYRKCTTSTL